MMRKGKRDQKERDNFLKKKEEEEKTSILMFY